MGFVKKTENFTCERCGTKVQGTGFTNHCPFCLWSKHVDKNIPGDRNDSCHGLMEPIGVELIHKEYSLLHHCQKCGKTSKNKTSSEDSFEEIIKLSNKINIDLNAL